MVKRAEFCEMKDESTIVFKGQECILIVNEKCYQCCEANNCLAAYPQQKEYKSFSDWCQLELSSFN